MHTLTSLFVLAISLVLISAFGCSHDDEPAECKTYVETGNEEACKKCLKLMPDLRKKLCSLADDDQSDFCNFDKCKFDRCCNSSDIPNTRPDGCPLCFKTTI